MFSYYFSSSLVIFSSSKFEFSSSSPPPVATFELQRSVQISDRQIQAVHLTASSSDGAITAVNRFRNSTTTTVIKKLSTVVLRKKHDLIMIKHGLARARASIHKAASTRNISSIIHNINDDDFVPNRAIYRNPGAFYHSMRSLGGVEVVYDSRASNSFTDSLVKMGSRESGDFVECGDGDCPVFVYGLRVVGVSLAVLLFGVLVPLSYLEMERRFKVYVYREGELPITHNGPCKDIYTIEGRFISEMEHGAKRFRTSDPHRAHVYFLPFSVVWMVKYLYKPLTYDLTPLKQFVADYVRVVSTKYPFWNRTSGADHFMLACHDWGPNASQGNSQLYNTSIRVLCNANTSEGFNPQKDVSLPEIHLYGGNISPKLLSLPPSHAPRPYLAFFAGGLHGPIRPILFQHWKDREDDMIKVYEYLPKDLDYYSFMLKSKFCLCPSGYEVASPRIVEAIYAECVPVILSNHYVLPFSDVLRWEAFSIQVDVSEIPRLKEVLMAVTEEKYRILKENLRFVRRHFVLNQPAKRFDVFHMILHSIWLRRLNMREMDR
ncbi:hypothetical protein EZV62_013551 [Acer yangbiense]|uniref:Exostosin GT47 domain-containing protein n=1 Tax=Acer yangbiense TaxID=1000413 RepID=A0A5C7HZJ7_9ROSI|nr:hypothetical protein EZV62_013551 [Acer yangbiense]